LLWAHSEQKSIFVIIDEAQWLGHEQKEQKNQHKISELPNAVNSEDRPPETTPHTFVFSVK
jgi:zona occludens toxin (predicted ATPase)